MATSITYDASRALQQLRNADQGVQAMGIVVKTLAEAVDKLSAEVDRLSSEVDRLKRDAP